MKSEIRNPKSEIRENRADNSFGRRFQRLLSSLIVAYCTLLGAVAEAPGLSGARVSVLALSLPSLMAAASRRLPINW